MRSDIYAVGATLYYLLTGRPPFDDRELLTLVTKIATDAPASPSQLQPRVPKELETIVLRCLTKDRAERPATYTELAEALRPFSSAAPTPAPLGRRVAAGIIDWALLFVFGWILNASAMARVMSTLDLQTLTADQGTRVWTSVVVLASDIIYFSVLEGVWGASLGKRVCDLRVVGPSGHPPGLPRGLLRAGLFATVRLFQIIVPWIIWTTIVSTNPSELGLRVGGLGTALLAALTTWMAPIAGLLLLFSTARRRNGFSGLHDRLSRTRVVIQAPRAALASSGVLARAVPVPVDRRYGPFEVTGSLGHTDRGELLVAFDPVLRRSVWIHLVAAAEPAVSVAVRDAAREGRLRWLGGHRGPDEAWDAYDGWDGAPMVAMISEPRPWRVVRRWLTDLADEIAAAWSDGSLGVLALDRVWITGAGRAKLLEFGAPGVPADHRTAYATSSHSPLTFLDSVARGALAGSAGSATAPALRAPLPFGASTWLHELSRNTREGTVDLLRRAATVASGREQVTPMLRAAHIALCGAGPLSTAVLALMMTAALATNAGLIEAMEFERALSTVSSPLALADKEFRRHAEVYLVGRFRSQIADERTWTNPAIAPRVQRHRQLATEIVAAHPEVSPDDLAKATAALGPSIQASRQLMWGSASDQAARALLVFWVVLLPLTLVGTLSAYVGRGGLLLRMLGIAVVGQDGLEVSRGRALKRAFVAWLLPWLGMAAAVWAIGGTSATSIVIAALFIAGAIWAIVKPERGLQDYAAGTWLVPR